MIVPISLSSAQFVTQSSCHLVIRSSIRVHNAFQATEPFFGITLTVAEEHHVLDDIANGLLSGDVTAHPFVQQFCKAIGRHGCAFPFIQIKFVWRGLVCWLDGWLVGFTSNQQTNQLSNSLNSRRISGSIHCRAEGNKKRPPPHFLHPVAGI